ncbi:MAG: DUF1178 family protein [Acidiferrobacterales bacterium]
MIIYDLRCHNDHQFEGWFKTSDDFRLQKEGGVLNCPVCGSLKIAKLPTASRINRHSSAKNPSTGQLVNAEQTLLKKIHDYVDSNFVDVGSEFPEQARKIYYGEAKPAPIRGTATLDEARELNEEGVDIISLPPAPVNKEKLN